MGFEQDLQDRYNKLYNARKATLKTKLDTGLNDIASEETNVNTNFNNLLNKLNQAREQSKGQFYGMRNNVDTAYNNNMNNFRELSASKGWRGGELMQGYLNQSNTRQNELGNVLDNETQTFNQYQNQENEATTNKMNLLQQLLNKRNLLNSNYENEGNSIKDELEAQRMGELSQWKQQQEAQARARASSSRSLKSSGGSKKEVDPIAQRKKEMQIADDILSLDADDDTIYKELASLGLERYFKPRNREAYLARTPGSPTFNGGQDLMKKYFG